MGDDMINNLQEEAAGKASNGCHLVVMPYPAKGHSNPMMNLSKRLASKRPDILITFVTEDRLGYNSSNSGGNYPANMRFANIPNDILPSEESHNADTLSFGKAVMTKLGAPFELILDTLHPPVTTILTDISLSWAVEAGNCRNIPVAALWIPSISEFSMQCHLNIFKEKQFSTDLEEHADYIVDFIPGISPIRVADLPRFFLRTGQSVAIDGWTLNLPISKIQYLVSPSIYELESRVFDFLRAKLNFPIYPFGPLIPFFELNNNKTTASTPDYIQWLDSQPASSVLYIAMGSIVSISSAQMDEMVAGFKSSGARFLWVGRGNTSRLKDGCGDQGMVVPWCDQLRVLGHPSVGGYLTHGGLSSILEASISGVPMLTFPIAGDQFPNCKLVVEDWKVGWRLRTVVGADKLITREAIAKTVKKFMDMNDSERKELTKTAKQLQETIKGAAAKGGSSDANLDAFLKDITQDHAH
ncbi:hypothetical protein JRO89_XS13G0208800 [Xanthoceras sorbifolium]|uniref:Glycosyltransferase n=1 Tax=Xanthoceras sorbifolium TaxID=99658 RepID=A0ABQ8H9E5_9ROSI|nr:hypothetical protein JRO89_XS13G0208800 [Xanthoceras sorbifolium]